MVVGRNYIYFEENKSNIYVNSWESMMGENLLHVFWGKQVKYICKFVGNP